MGRGSTVLGLIALILAASGLALGGFAWLSVSRLETQMADLSEQNSWYKYNGTTFKSDPISSYLTFSGLTIEFELGPNESVYFSFTARAHIEHAPVAWSRITVYFRVDGTLGFTPSAQVGMYNGDFFINYMLHLQDVRHDLSAGEHNVTVVILGDSTANYLYGSSLFVQKVLI